MEIEQLLRDKIDCTALHSFFTIWLKEPVARDEWIDQYNQLKEDRGFPLLANMVNQQAFEIQVKRHMLMNKVAKLSMPIPHASLAFETIVGCLSLYKTQTRP